jgi:catechol 2,3-dioxygenase-like lactoylglutathione lyase family enzyme
MRLIALLATALLLAAHPAMADNVSSTYLRTAIFVPDRAATVKFFREVMGYDELDTSPVDASDSLGLPKDAKVTLTGMKSKDGAGLSIMGVESPRFKPLARAKGVANAGGDVMLVHQVTGIAEIYTRAKAGGYEILMAPKLSRAGKSMQMFLRDPNRVRLELYELLSPSK